MKVIKIHANANKDGTFQFYVDLSLPSEYAERYGRNLITLPIYNTRTDEARGFNRAANVRAIPPGSSGFWIYRVLRSDSESLNRGIEDSMYRHHRAHSVGWRRQWVDMLGFALLTNSLTLARFRKQNAQEAA